MLGIFYEGDPLYTVFDLVKDEFFPGTVKPVVFLEGLSPEEFTIDVSEMSPGNVVHVSPLPAIIPLLVEKSILILRYLGWQHLFSVNFYLFSYYLFHHHRFLLRFIGLQLFSQKRKKSLTSVVYLCTKDSTIIDNGLTGRNTGDGAPTEINHSRTGEGRTDRVNRT